MSTAASQNTFTAPAGLRRHLQALGRRRKSFIIACVAGIAASVTLAFMLPPTYRSSATILIEQQEMPQEMVRSTITTYADQRVQMISQRVMTTTNLLEIVRRYNLYPDRQKNEPREALLARLRKDIEMEMISADVIDPRSGRPTRATIAFSVAYQSRSPELAVKVANELTSLYLNENLTSRTQRAQDTEVFLADEAGRLSDEISTLETRLSEFKQRHIEALPELSQLNYEQLNRAELEQRDIESRLRSLVEQKVFLEAQLAQLQPNSQIFTDSGERILSSADRLKSLRSRLASLQALYASDHPDVLRVQREIEGLEQQGTPKQGSVANNDVKRRLDDARTQLAALREKYSPDHPDVVRLTREVAGLEASSVAKPRDVSGVDDADNPAYIQIRAQLNNTVTQLQSLERRGAELKKQIAQQESRLASAPEVEREFRALSRDYENAQAKYQEVRAKQMEAQLAQNLEADRKGERFTLIEPPLPPEEPVSPNRLGILFLGLVLSLGLGFGLVTLRESLDSAIRGRGDLLSLLETAPLAIIPRIEVAAQRRQRRRRRYYTAAGTAAMVVGAAVSLHFLYRPLDLLWLAVMRRLGV